jgi:hypothetical protein
LSLFENGPSLVAIQIKPFFYIMFVFGCKINTFCRHFKENISISFLLFIEYFKFIKAYHILLTICKAESIFITQIVRLRKITKISASVFLHISTNRRTFATEIKQIVIEIFERLAKSQISKEIRHER